jgi:hypothetical protein
MSRERDIVIRIEQFLSLTDQTANPELQELAEQYNAVCRDVNLMLQKCDEFLTKNMWLEAVHLAKTPPSVLERYEAIQLPQMDKWREVCLLYGYPEPPALLHKVVEKLKAAEQKANTLSPILAVHRRIARIGSTKQKIHVLRRIARLDPENPNWIEDIKALEQVRIGEIGQKLDEAVARGDDDTVLSLHNEMTSARWKIQIIASVQKRVEEEARVVRQKRAQRDGDALLQRMGKAYSELDFHGVEVALTEWSNLRNNPDFQPLPAQEQQVEEAREWYEAEAKKKKKKEKFTEIEADLADALDRDAGQEQIERLLFKLKTFEFEIEPPLLERAQSMMDGYRLAGKRRFRLRLVAVTIIAAAIAAGVWYATIIAKEKREIQKWVTSIDSALQQNDYDSAKKLIDRLRVTDSGVFENPEIQRRKAKIEDELQRSAKRHEDFKTVMAKLESLIKDENTPDPEAQSLLNEAIALAQDDQERLQIEKWKNKHRLIGLKAQEERDAAFSVILKKIVDALVEVGDLQPEKEYEECRSRLDRIHLHYEEGKLLAPGASPELANHLESLKVRISALSKELEEVRARQEERRERLRAVYSSLPDIERYKGALIDYIRKFPEEKESDSFRRIVSHCPYFAAVGSAEKLYAAASRGKIEDLKAAIALSGDEKNIWRQAAETLCAYVQAEQNAQQAVAPILELSQNRLMYDLKNFTYFDGKNSRTCYCYDLPVFLGESKEGDATIKSYAAEVYNNTHLIVKVNITVDSRTGSRIEIPQEDASYAPHAKFLRQLLPELRASNLSQPESDILTFIEKVKNNSDINPVIKASLIRIMIRSALGLTVSNRGMLEKTLGELDKVNLNVFWMNPADPEVDRTVGLIKKILSDAPAFDEIAAITRMERAFVETSLTRRVACVGVVQLIGGEPIFYCGNKRPKEAWILHVVPESKTVEFHIAAEFDKDKYVAVKDTIKNLYEGQPLFAPMDGKSTKEVIMEATRTSNFPKGIVSKFDRWPSSWPVNSRVLQEK